MILVRRAFYCILALMLLLAPSAYGQRLSNLRCIELPAVDCYFFDTVVVIPNSFILYQNQQIVPDSLFTYLLPDKKLVVSDFNKEQPIRICYRVLPEELTKAYYVMSPPEIKTTRRAYQFEFSSQERTNLQTTYNQLVKSGSVSRGISVSSNRDVSLTGGLNLQMSGKIVPDLWLAASLTDANIPIQPEGNTAQLNEFDKIFIQVYNDKISATLGDYQLSLRENRFLRAEKKQQGFIFEVKAGKADSSKFVYSGLTSASISKGKYNRQTLVSIEGNQGPYKLQGSNNERFIIIIAGSERVFIDGILLERGEISDYIIDYNSAEITFTPKRPISRESRITVEFEYTDRTYARFVAAHVSKWQNNRSHISVSILAESDAKNQTIDTELKEEWITLLSDIGDQIDSALVLNVREEAFDPEAVRYARQDTIYQGITYDIFRYSVNPDSARYSVGFSYVGIGRGDYVSISGLVNGRIFKWVAPQNGVKQGDYAPVTLLVPPSSKQNIAINACHAILPNMQVYGELTYSHSDLNTFSTKDSHDNHGMAMVSGIRFGTDTSTWSGMGEYQFIHRYFDTFEPYRSTEFERDWNLSTNQNRENQHQATLKTGWYRKNIGKAGYTAEAFLRGNEYSGVRNNVQSSFGIRNYKLNADLSMVNSQADSLKSRFIKTNLRTGYDFSRVQTGVQLSVEDNVKEIFDTITDPTAFRFYDLSAFAETRGAGKLSLKLSSGIRNDDKVANNELRAFTLSTYAQSEGELQVSQAQTWGYLINYKKIEVRNSENWPDVKSDNVLSGRVTSRMSVLKRLLTLSNFYEIGSGLESKKEYAYLKTIPGEGTHIWRDLNGNGIKEISEFEQAPIQAEADYIRYFIPTGEYVSAYYCRFRSNINVNMNRWQGSEKKVLRAISRFSNQTNFQLNHKIIEKNFLSYGNPFYVPNADSVLLSNQLSFRSVFSYGRSHPVWGIDYTIVRNENRQLLANGFEIRATENQSVVFRLNALLWLTVLNESAINNSIYQSQAFSFKDYTITSLINETRFEVQPGTETRFEAKYQYANKENNLSTNQVESHQFTLGFQYSKAKKGNLNAQVGFIQNNFSGDETNPTNYELLEGYQIGKNVTWQLGSIIKVSKHFQLTLQYHGRSAPDIKTIHTGSMMVKAFF